jgi:hypothetical protein
MVGRIAELNLSNDAKAAIAVLLPDPQLTASHAISDSSLASFADHVRRNPNYPQYKFLNDAHFVDIPVSPAFDGDPLTFCQEAKCVISAIEDFKVTLASKTLPKARRQEALAFLVHFVGDLHQPLHCATRNDRGGNGLHVTFLGTSGHHSMNLHSVWDDNLVKVSMPTPNAFTSGTKLNEAIKDEERTAWQAGTTKDWAMESYGLARKVSYQSRGMMLPTTGEPDLDQAYVDKAKPVVVSQIKKAGIRLAKVLNDALKQ